MRFFGCRLRTGYENRGESKVKTLYHRGHRGKAREKREQGKIPVFLHLYSHVADAADDVVGVGLALLNGNHGNGKGLVMGTQHQIVS